MSLEIKVVPVAEFASVQEEGARPLAGEPGDVLVPVGGIVLFYGDGGAGKTTLTIDCGCHLAAGQDWLGIPISEPVRVLVIENEGPRALFRDKLRRKLAGWQGQPFADRIQVLEEPWASLSFAEEGDRAALADVIREGELDVVIVGPVTAAGMLAAGTIQEVREFAHLVGLVRTLSGRSVTFILIHHEGKSGSVSGAWEGVGDTLLHVSLQGHGKTRVHVQKARWASSYHGTTLQLGWADGDGFEREDKPEVDDKQIAEAILAYIADHPGTGWTRVEEATKGIGHEKRRAIRDHLLQAGKLVNISKEDELLDHVPERLPARLYLADHSPILPLRRAPGADAAQTPDASAPCAPAVIGAHGVGADDAPTFDDDEWLADLEHSSLAIERGEDPYAESLNGAGR